MRIIVVMLLLLLTGCGIVGDKSVKRDKMLDPNIQFIGEASAYNQGLSNKVQPAFGGDHIIEVSTINEGDYLSLFCDVGAKGNLNYGYTTNNRDFYVDGMASMDRRFSYIFKHNSIYYMAYCAEGSGMDIFLMKSIDSVNWEYLNEGNPILTKSEDINSIYYYLWNVAITIDNNDVWHLFVESAPKVINNYNLLQGGVGLAYSTATLSGDLIEFDTNRQASQLVPFGGNPWAEYKDGKIELIYGSTERGHWSIKAGIFDMTTFTESDFEIYEPGVHICDPHLVETTDGRKMLSYSYAQLYTFFAYKEN